MFNVQVNGKQPGLPILNKPLDTSVFDGVEIM